VSSFSFFVWTCSFLFLCVFSLLYMSAFHSFAFFLSFSCLAFLAFLVSFPFPCCFFLLPSAT